MVKISDILETRAAVSCEELGALIGKHTMTIRRWVYDGKIQSVKVGPCVMIPICEVKKFMGKGIA